jgi:ribose transport system substrate-binding protein
MPKNGKRLLCMMLGVAALVLAVAGCGSSSDSSSSTEAESGSENSGEIVKAAEATVAEAMEPVTEFNGPSSSPKPPTGKTVYVISCSPDTEGCQRDVGGAIEAVEEIGWSAKRIDTKGTPEEFVSALEQAMNGGADGIIAASFPVETIEQPLKKAEEKGIPVVTMLAGNPVPKVGSDFKGGLFAEVDTDGKLQGKYAADWIIQQTKAEAEIGVLNTPEFPILNTRLEGFETEFAKCSGCNSAETLDVPVNKIAAEASSSVANFLQANPNVNYFMPTYDGVALFAVQAIKQVGDDGKVPVIAFDGNKPNLALIENGEVQEASIVSPHEWDGWAATDEINRAFAGEPPAMEWQPGGGGIPTKLLDKTNLPPAGQSWTGDINYKAEFKKLWGIN